MPINQDDIDAFAAPLADVLGDQRLYINALTPAYRHQYRRALLGDKSAYAELARIAEAIKTEVGDNAGLSIIIDIERELESLFKGVLE